MKKLLVLLRELSIHDNENLDGEKIEAELSEVDVK